MRDSEIKKQFELISNKLRELEIRNRLLNEEIERIKLENQFNKTVIKEPKNEIKKSKEY